MDDRSLTERFDALGNKLLQVIDGHFEAINERFGSINVHLEAINERFEVINERFGAIDKRFDKVDQELAGVRSDIENLAAVTGKNFLDLEDRLSERIDVVEGRTASIERTMLTRDDLALFERKI